MSHTNQLNCQPMPNSPLHVRFRHIARLHSRLRPRLLFTIGDRHNEDEDLHPSLEHSWFAGHLTLQKVQLVYSMDMLAVSKNVNPSFPSGRVPEYTPQSRPSDTSCYQLIISDPAAAVDPITDLAIPLFDIIMAVDNTDEGICTDPGNSVAFGRYIYEVQDNTAARLTLIPQNTFPDPSETLTNDNCYIGDPNALFDNYGLSFISSEDTTLNNLYYFSSLFGQTEQPSMQDSSVQADEQVKRRRGLQKRQRGGRLGKYYLFDRSSTGSPTTNQAEVNVDVAEVMCPVPISSSSSSRFFSVTATSDSGLLFATSFTSFETTSTTTMSNTAKSRNLNTQEAISTVTTSSIAILSSTETSKATSTMTSIGSATSPTIEPSLPVITPTVTKYGNPDLPTGRVPDFASTSRPSETVCYQVRISDDGATIPGVDLTLFENILVIDNTERSVCADPSKRSSRGRVIYEITDDTGSKLIPQNSFPDPNVEFTNDNCFLTYASFDNYGYSFTSAGGTVLNNLYFVDALQKRRRYNSLPGYHLYSQSVGSVAGTATQRKLVNVSVVMVNCPLQGPESSSSSWYSSTRSSSSSTTPTSTPSSRFVATEFTSSITNSDIAPFGNPATVTYEATPTMTINDSNESSSTMTVGRPSIMTFSGRATMRSDKNEISHSISTMTRSNSATSSGSKSSTTSSPTSPLTGDASIHPNQVSRTPSGLSSSSSSSSSISASASSAVLQISTVFSSSSEETDNSTIHPGQVSATPSVLSSFISSLGHGEGTMPSTTRCETLTTSTTSHETTNLIGPILTVTTAILLPITSSSVTTSGSGSGVSRTSNTIDHEGSTGDGTDSKSGSATAVSGSGTLVLGGSADAFGSKDSASGGSVSLVSNPSFTQPGAGSSGSSGTSGSYETDSSDSSAARSSGISSISDTSSASNYDSSVFSGASSSGTSGLSGSAGTAGMSSADSPDSPNTPSTSGSGTLNPGTEASASSLGSVISGAIGLQSSNPRNSGTTLVDTDTLSATVARSPGASSAAKVSSIGTSLPDVSQLPKSTGGASGASLKTVALVLTFMATLVLA